MTWLHVSSYDELAKNAADLILSQIREKPASVLGLATGSSPVGVYDELADAYRAGKTDFSRVRTVNLDEYVGLSADDPQSYHTFMREQLFSHVNIKNENTYIPDGCAVDLAAACRAYDATIAALGGIDLQLLGVGLNGHIGFNEPSDAFTDGTHVVDLSESTRTVNARFFASIDDVPRRAITMGIGSILRARKILLIASGAEKEGVLTRAFSGAVTPRLPVSVLSTHLDVTVIVCS